MSAPKFAIFAIVGLALCACVASPNSLAPGPMVAPGPREGAGTVVGAGTGALLGAAVASGGGGKRPPRAAGGGGGGGPVGQRSRGGAGRGDRERAWKE